jgi:G3E family GTPase
MTVNPGHTQVPVTILTGFLGSGKTTVLNYLLRQPELRGVVAIINEFGEVGLDHLLVETSEERFALLDNGCICCSVREDLVQTLKDLKARCATGSMPAFHRVLVETTGLADPVPVLHTLMTSPDLLDEYRIDGIVATVDAINGGRTLSAHPEAVKQLAVADRILMTKVDLADPEDVASLMHRIGTINPTATVLRASNGAVDASSLLDAGLFDPQARSRDVAAWFEAAAIAAAGSGEGSAHHHHHCDDPDCDHAAVPHAHDAQISSFSLIISEPIRWAAFSQWLEYVAALKGDDLLRFNGLVNVAEIPGGPVVVHGVQHVFHPPIEMKNWPSADRSTRLVFIVRNIPREIIERTLTKFAAISREAIHRPAA